MPLVKFVGIHNSPDGTGRIKLKDGSDGLPRYIDQGGPAVEVSGEELQAVLGSGCSVVVLDDAPASASAPEPTFPPPSSASSSPFSG